MPTDLELSTDDMIEAAIRFRSDASSADVAVVGEGQLSIALRIGDVVMRFPRSEFARTRLEREVVLLERIRPLLTVSVPDIVGADLDAQLGKAFVAHRYLPGSIVTPERVGTFSDGCVARIAESVRALLSGLHPLMSSVSDLLPSAPTMQEFAQSLRNEVERWLAPRMSAAQRSRADGELDAISKLAPAKPVLAHTDLGGNILLDDAGGPIAFIDFGSAMVADPVLDLASLSVLGPELTRRCVDAYPPFAQCARGAAAVSSTFHLQDALYGARQADWSYVDDVLSGYEGR